MSRNSSGESLSYKMLFQAIDPPGHGRIVGHYFHTWYPSVRQKIKTHFNANVDARITKTTDTMSKNNDHLLTGAWWVTLKSPDLFYFTCTYKVYFLKYLYNTFVPPSEILACLTNSKSAGSKLWNCFWGSFSFFSPLAVKMSNGQKSRILINQVKK